MISRLFTWLEGLVDTLPANEPTKPPNTLSAFIWHYAQPFWKLIALSSLLSGTIAFFEVYLFAFLGDLVDWLSESERLAFWAKNQSELVFMAAVIVLIIPALKFMHQTISHQGVIGNFPMHIRWQAHRYLLRQSIHFFEDDFAGRIAAKMMQTALGVREAVMKIAEVLVYVAVYFFGGILLFMSNDWRLAAPMILWFVAYVLILRYFIPKMRVISQKQADARSSFTGRVVDSYTNINTVKMFSHTDFEDQYAKESMQDFLKTVHPQMRLAALLVTYLNIINALLLFAVGALSIWLWQINTITVGTIALALGLILRLQGMSQWIMWELASLFEHFGVVQDGMTTLSQNQAINDKPSATKLKVSKGEIKIDSVNFNYGRQADGSQLSVLHDFSLHIQAGEKIGLVGHSGAGKSTLVNLLLRFYDIESGQIQIDQQPIGDVTQNSLRAQIGMVTQDTSLLHRSVTENIGYGQPELDVEAVINAAKQAHAHEFILDLVDIHGRQGYDAHVGERGVKLSGGQRQRIAIARVLLKNAPILILDEATSALDSETEASIQQSLSNLMQDKTVIAIAHRLSTIAAMDRLVVMDQGRIVEQGSHDDLLKQGGIYADLWARQSGGFLMQ